jgi:transaldolase
VDTAVDKALEEIGTPDALVLRGKAAIANAKLAYRRFCELFCDEQREELKRRDARIQKPLWASTGTKNKAYSDVLYIEELVGPETINSVPPATIEAFRDHGRAANRLLEGQKEAEEVVGKLLALDVNLRSIGSELTEEGVEKFEKSYDQLLKTLEDKQRTLTKSAA